MRPEILARYAGQRLPRYTSYPPSPHFGPEVTDARYRQSLADLPHGGGEASLYLHVPFCRSMCWYCGCHTTVARRDDPIIGYLAALRREITLVADAAGARLPTAHIHFGGGTPTILHPDDFVRLAGLLRREFAVATDAEVAVEIDPRTLTAAMVTALAEAGVTRASLGVQSFDGVVQKAINRVQSFEQTAAAVEGLRRAGIRAVNFDLIYGLPHQTVASCRETVERCLALRPDRLSVFGYAHVPGFKKHQRRIDAAALPDAQARHEQAEAIAAMLQGRGYHRIGLDHYALPSDKMAAAQESGGLRRNFQGYTTDRSDVLIGFGASAIGRLPQGYVQNEVVLGRYAERVRRGELPVARGYALTRDDRLRADLIERLMCDFRVDLGKVCEAHAVASDAVADALPALRALTRDGLIRFDGAVVEVNPEARSLVRSVAAAFDAHRAPPGRTHSPAV
ncbi:MAG TPA: oxygen-independent coproporphyrinogen III oxidase [Beijerinckiaceae bacterium]|jgi:oxygen-independent coproporphyrinogen-3 oxidase